MKKAGGPSKSSETAEHGAATTSKSTLASSEKAKRPGLFSSKGTDDELRRYKDGEKVLVLWGGKWHNGKVCGEDVGTHPETGLDVPCYLIHYAGFSSKYDELVMADSLMLLNPENQAKADAETADFERRQKLNPSSSKKMPSSSVKKVKVEVHTPKRVKSEEPPVKSEEASRTEASFSASGDGDAVLSLGHLKTPATEKPKSGKRGRPGKAAASVERASLETVGAASAASVMKKEAEKVTTAPLPSVNPDEGSKSTVQVDENATEENIQRSTKNPRNDEDAALLLEHYNAYDPNNPKAKIPTGTKDRLMYHSLSSLGLIPVHPADAQKTPEEKQDTFMRATEQLMFLKCAELRKAQDEAVISIQIPPGIRRLMAENYIQTVLKEKLLKNITLPEKSFRAIMGRYIAYAEKTPKEFSFYQQKSRLAEAKLLVENFPKMFPAIALRMEWPQLTDAKKKVDLSMEYGLVHVVRAIQLMVDFFNVDGKRLVGAARQKLTVIYEDMLGYLEEHELKNCDEGDAMYETPTDEYVSRIAWIVYENDGEDASILPFQFLSDKFFQTLSPLPKELDEAVKLTWKLAPSSSAMEKLG